MPEWSKAPQEVIDIAEELISNYHSHLEGANIGFLFRDEPIVSMGKIVMGQASKFPVKMQPYVSLDFLIWIAEESWHQLGYTQKLALIDHELCHCAYNEDKDTWTMRKHDVEEFNEIIERYGFWKRDLFIAKHSFQMALDLEGGDKKAGRVVAVDPELMTE